MNEVAILAMSEVLFMHKTAEQMLLLKEMDTQPKGGSGFDILPW